VVVTEGLRKRKELSKKEGRDGEKLKVNDDGDGGVMVGLLKEMKSVYTFHREVRSNVLTQQMSK
jgi:hypothetical protein